MQLSNRQKQCLIANEILLTPNDAIFIHINLKKENLKDKKIDEGGKIDSLEDDKIMSLPGLKWEYLLQKDQGCFTA